MCIKRHYILTETFYINPEAKQTLDKLMQLEKQASDEQLFVVSYLIPVVSMLCDSPDEFEAGFAEQIEKNIGMDRLSPEDEIEIRELIKTLGL